MPWIHFTPEEADLVLAGLKCLPAEKVQALTQQMTERFKPDDAERLQSELFVEVARDCFASDGDLEFDEDALVSLVSFGDDEGAYVMCWKWVDDATVNDWVMHKS